MRCIRCIQVSIASRSKKRRCKKKEKQKRGCSVEKVKEKPIVDDYEQQNGKVYCLATLIEFGFEEQ